GGDGGVAVLMVPASHPALSCGRATAGAEGALSVCVLARRAATGAPLLSGALGGGDDQPQRGRSSPGEDSRAVWSRDGVWLVEPRWRRRASSPGARCQRRDERRAGRGRPAGSSSPLQGGSGTAGAAHRFTDCPITG